MTELKRWLAEWQQPDTVWYIKRLPAHCILSSSTERNEWLMPAHIMARAFPELYMVRAGHTTFVSTCMSIPIPSAVPLE